MPELALHFAVPFAVTAPVLGVRKAIAVSFVSLLPDLDVFFHVHRSPSHSIILLLVVSLVAVGLVSRLIPKYLSLASVGCLTLLMHPIMDLFSTYTPILYPLALESFYLDFEGRLMIGGSTIPTSTSQVDTTPTVFESFERLDAPMFTSEGFIVSLLLVAVPFLMIILRHARFRRGLGHL